jgi:hypothetical protein
MTGISSQMSTPSPMLSLLCANLEILVDGMEIHENTIESGLLFYVVVRNAF